MLDLVEQALVLGLLEPDLHLRPGLGVAAQELRQDARAGALERPHPQRPGLTQLQRLHIGAGRLQPGHDCLGMPQEQPPRLGQLHRPRAARAFDEPRADQPLEGRDLLADRRLRVSQGGRRPPERAVLGDRLERGQVPQLDSQPLIRFHDGNHRYVDLI